MTQVTHSAGRDLRGRNLSIDSLRGVAILLMVAGHVIGSGNDRGMGVADDSVWRYFSLGLEDMRMPLFAALSGYIYAQRPVYRPDAIRGLVKGKARRLLVPLVTVGTLFFFMQLLVPGTNRKPELAEFWKVFVYGMEHLWFVQATFLIFLLVGLLDAFGILRSLRRWGVALLTSSFFFVFVSVSPVYDVFSMSGAIRLLPFFLLGYGFSKFAAVIAAKKVLLVSAIAFLVIYSVRIATIAHESANESPAMRTLMLGVGIFAVTIVILVRGYITSSKLAWLGQHSFGIYLLHVFGSAGVRMLLVEAGIESEILIFIVCMTAAVGLPILFERTLGRVAVVSWAFLGQRPHRPLLGGSKWDPSSKRHG